MIQSAVSHVRELTAADPRPWLVVGKGPTSDAVADVDPAAYHVLTLNHACRLVPAPALAHFVDVEAFLECGDRLAQGLTPTALPWHPHVGHKPSPLPLPGFCGLFGERGRSVALAWLLGKDRLLSYNASTAGGLPRNVRLPDVRLRFFGAVAAFNVLAAAGVREVASLGVDGGTGYGSAFDHKDRLANGRTSFDAQTNEIRHTVKACRMRWTRLGAVKTTFEAAA